MSNTIDKIESRNVIKYVDLELEMLINAFELFEDMYVSEDDKELKKLMDKAHEILLNRRGDFYPDNGHMVITNSYACYVWNDERIKQ